MKFRNPLLSVLAAACLVASSGCGSSSGNARLADTQASGDGVLRIGMILDNAGSQAFLNASQQAAVKLAAKQANDAGGLKGKPVQVLAAPAGDPAAQAKSLVEAKADVVIGPTDSAHAPAVIDVLARAKTVLISPANTAAGLSTFPSAGYYFRTAAADTVQAVALTNLAKEAGRHKVAVIHEEGTYGKEVGEAVAKAISAAGLQQGADVVVKAGAAQSAAASIADADAVVVVAREGAAAILGALNGAGVPGEKILLADGAVAPYGSALAVGALGGAHGVLPGRFPSPEFTSQILAVDPGLKDLTFAAEAFDATMLAILAAAAADDDAGSSVASHLIAVSGGNTGGSASAAGAKCSTFIECTGLLKQHQPIDYEGVSGAVNFDRNGDVTVADYVVYTYGDDNKPKMTGTQTAVRPAS